MVALPLFKLGAVFIRHVSKYGANYIKRQAHEHPGFRAFAAKYGQAMHRLRVRTDVLFKLRETEWEAKQQQEKAAAPTVKTEEQVRKEEELKAKYGVSSSKKSRSSQPVSVLTILTREVRPTAESKAVALFADVIGDVFVLSVAVAAVVFEWYRSSNKPDPFQEKIEELERRLGELGEWKQHQEDLGRGQTERIWTLEEALRHLKDPKTKRSLFQPASSTTPPPSSAQTASSPA